MSISSERRKKGQRLENRRLMKADLDQLGGIKPIIAYLAVLKVHLSLSVFRRMHMSNVNILEEAEKGR